MTRLARRASLLVAFYVLIPSVGCAPSLTPQQQRVYSAWDQCVAERRVDLNIRLERIGPDGRYWVTVLGGQAGREAANQCMSEKLGSGRWQ